MNRAPSMGPRSEVPKTSLRVQGSQELRKAVTPTVVVYYSERIHVKISKRNRNIGQIPSSCALSVGSHGDA